MLVKLSKIVVCVTGIIHIYVRVKLTRVIIPVESKTSYNT